MVARRGHLGVGGVRNRGAEASQRLSSGGAVPRRSLGPAAGRRPAVRPARPAGLDQQAAVRRLLVLGFVPALIFSWVYELTPEGLKREHEIERNASITAETARKLDLIVVGLLVVAIVVVAVERFIPRTAPIPAATDAASGASSAEAPVQAAAKSIAVLPFVNMSGDAGNRIFRGWTVGGVAQPAGEAARAAGGRAHLGLQVQGREDRRAGGRRRSSTSRTSWRAACGSPARRSASRRS